MNATLPVVAFIGVGTMAEAMVDKAIAGGWPRERMILTHRREERRRELAQRFGGRVEEDNLAAARRAGWIVVAVRPQECADMLASLTPGFRRGQSLLSICAGLTVAWLRERVPEGMRVVRVTPPPTTSVGAGVTLLSGGEALPDTERIALERLVIGTCERVEWIADELMEPITATTLALTPYTCLLLKTMIAAGVEQGVDEKFMRRMVIDCISATAKLLREGGHTPEEIIDTLATREGLTWSAIHTMEAYGVTRGLRAGARAMTGRSYELRGELVPNEHMGFQR